jgi:hypothetical protein
MRTVTAYAYASLDKETSPSIYGIHTLQLSESASFASDGGVTQQPRVLSFEAVAFNAHPYSVRPVPPTDTPFHPISR